MERTYIAIDLKSFYASVECVERGLDPLTAHLVVADKSRTSKTICLAVSPAMKALGIPGRPRLFEVEQQIRTLNTLRRNKAPGKHFGSGFFYCRSPDGSLYRYQYPDLSALSAFYRTGGHPYILH